MDELQMGYEHWMNAKIGLLSIWPSAELIQWQPGHCKQKLRQKCSTGYDATLKQTCNEQEPQRTARSALQGDR
jgi:hypothetical protein